VAKWALRCRQNSCLQVFFVFFFFFLANQKTVLWSSWERKKLDCFLDNRGFLWSIVISE
jgi:hypothetical protein